MAIIGDIPQPPKTQKFPQSKYIDSIRWLPSPSPFHKSAIIAFFDIDTNTPSLEIHSLNPSTKTLTATLSSWTPPSRISSLKSSPPSSPRPLSLARFISSTLFPVVELTNRKFRFLMETFTWWLLMCVDMMEGGNKCVSVGEDGRVNLIDLANDGGFSRVFDANGLVSYTAVKWASPTEFVTGGCGFGLQWWDLRRPGAPVAQFKGAAEQVLGSYTL